MLRGRSKALFAAMLLLLAAPVLPAQNMEKPPKVRNIVFILADDLGVMDLGCQGSDYYKTPNIDAFAKTAVRFTNAYAAQSVCSPTRASILTGRYPARLHFTAHIPGWSRPYARLMAPDWTPYIQKDEITYAEALRDAGFRTFHAGKWHVSSKTGPAAHGFQEVAPDLSPKGRDMEDPWYVDSYTKAVEDFMERNKDRPFLAVLSHGTVHVPLYEKEGRIAPWREVLPGKNGQNNPVMAAMIENLDTSVGRVLDKIKALGLEEETAVIFYSDNGGLTNVQDEKTGKTITATSNLPWRGGKSQSYEGGIRVPLLIRWPGVTAPGTLCSTPVISMDLFPTFLDMAGLPPLPGQHLDGLSLAPLFMGGKLERNNLFWHFPHYHTLPPHGAVRSGHWKMVLNYETDEAELFDLAADPGEGNNLAQLRPDVVKTLRDYLTRHLQAVGGQMPELNPNYQPGAQGKAEPARYDPREGDPARERRPVSTNPENGAFWPVPD